MLLHQNTHTIDTSQHTEQLEQRKHHQDFNLQDMGTIYDQFGGKPDHPHRHDYYTVLLVKEAEGKHVVDYQSYAFGNNQVHFVSPGQVHQVTTASRPSGWVITFSRDFLVENRIPESFISNINLFQQFGNTPPLEIDEPTLTKLTRFIDEMQECMPNGLLYRTRALGALLELFLIYCNNSCTLNPAQLDEENSGVCMLRDFKDLVSTKFNSWHKVSDYASEIHISAKHLSHTVKILTGKTAKEIIQDRLALEAKRLLLHTELNIKEVGYKLGFEEPLHFSSFFKKQVGISPTAFRDDKR